MEENSSIPSDPLIFIKTCLAAKKIYWTYHINMRVKSRGLNREMIINSNRLEIIESYPQDKYLPSYLLKAEYQEVKYHFLAAVDIGGDHIRIITAYLPDERKWDSGARERRKTE